MTASLPRAAAVLALAACGLAACSRPAATVAALPAICHDFKAPATPVVGADPGAAALQDCLRRWSYSLAASGEEAGAVAEAAVAACRGPLSTWNQAGLGQPGPEGDAASIITGQSTNPVSEHYAFAEAHALLYAVQAKAGRCAAPPIEKGAPAGLAPV